MPFAANQDIRIYYETLGQGPPLLCIHGLWGSHRAYVEGGWVAALGDSFRLLLPDLRGHGQSSKPHEAEAYAPNVMAADILAVLDAEEIVTANVLGYSLGGWVAHAVARAAPERVRALLVGGAGVDPHQTHNTLALRFALKALEGGIATFLHSVTLPNLTPQMREQLLSNDTEAVSALIAAWLAQPTDGLRQLTQFERPTLVFAGDRDPYAKGAQETAEALPYGRFVSLPGHTHDSALLNGADAIAAVRAFIQGLDDAQLGAAMNQIQ